MKTNLELLEEEAKNNKISLANTHELRAIAYKEKNILNTILHDLERIQNFNSVWQDKMGGEFKKSAEHLSVFYEEDILMILKSKGTYIKNDNGLYYIWTGRYWKSMKEKKLKRFIKTYITKRGLVPHRSSSVIDGTFKNIARSFEGVDYDIDHNVQLLNLNNGVLAISQDGIALGEHSRKHNLNYILDFDYDENAVNEIWHNFLDDVLPDIDTQKTLQQVLGNLLIRGIKIEVLPFLFGTGGNGKSVILEVLQGLFGSENLTGYSLTKISTDETIRASIADGKMMNLATENNMGNVDIDVVKAYSSGEPLQARLLYGDHFMVYNYAKFLGNLNKLSVMNGERTKAIYRRLLIIPFEQTITVEKADINLHTKILQNKSGILNWILEGQKQVMENVETVGKAPIYKSKIVQSLLSKYQVESDPVQQMLIEHDYNILTDNTTAKINWTPLQELYSEYAQFITDIGGGKLNRTNFKAELVTIEGIQFDKSRNKDVVNVSKLFSNESDKKEVVVEQNSDYEVPKSLL